jgi:hypothetical protein
MIVLKNRELFLVSGGLTNNSAQVCDGYAEGRMLNDKSSCFINGNEVTITWFDPDTNLYASNTKNYTCKDGSNASIILFDTDKWIKIGNNNTRICFLNYSNTCETFTLCKN